MSFIDSFYCQHDNQQFSVTAQQGSEFAKKVAGDFNPIHDPESPRFCVPGDLLFALTLNRCGVSESMAFRFLELVNADAQLSFSEDNNGAVHIFNQRQKQVLDVQRSGATSNNRAQIESLIKQYVSFSGHNFPQILLPLMKEHDVMINPKRPLVIYESMSFELAHVNFENLEIAIEGTEFEIEGKRGRATLQFTMHEGGVKLGSGLKTLLLSGLRPYEQSAIDAVSASYFASRDAYSG